MSGLSNKSLELIKEINRNIKAGFVSPFNETAIRLIFDEMLFLSERNQQDTTVAEGQGQGSSMVAAMRFRHAMLERIQRCVVTYIYHRMMTIRNLRWTFTSVIPTNIRPNVTAQEEQFFYNYTRLLSNYMRSIGNIESKNGLDLTIDFNPPRAYMIYVRVNKPWEVELDRGGMMRLTKDTIHMLPESRCELLIREKILENYEERPFKRFKPVF